MTGMALSVSVAGFRGAALALAVAFTGPAVGAEAPYDYPLEDAMEATVLGTPRALQARVPDQVPTEELRLRVFPQRTPPAVFWYAERLPVLVARQRRPAPLVYVVAGTGSSHAGASMRAMLGALYQAGFHVVTIASPTHPSFIVAASERQLPGLPQNDARDLYRVMRLVYAEVAGSIDITAQHLVGYSLGAAEAAFVARLDDAEGAIGFDRVLMINPPVSLYRSAEKLDAMVDAIPGGVDDFDLFFYQNFGRFAAAYQQQDVLDFTNDFLFTLYRRKPPPERTFEALIGITFRLAAANVLFTADVLNRAGVVVPKERVIATTDSLTEYAKVCAYLGFRQYMQHLLLPVVRRQRPETRFSDLVAASDLASIESYLRQAAKIGLMHNRDDPVLTAGDLDFLAEVFRGRARFYPRGGHLGNLNHHRNVADMIAFLKGEWGPE